MILAIDLGTSSCKLAIFDNNLVQVCSHSKEYPTLHPFPGWAEQPPDMWWEVVVAGIKELIHDSGISPASIDCIGVDSMGSALVPVSNDGVPLRNGLIWMDRRSEDQCKLIDRMAGDKLWEINGNHNDPSNIAPKILWLKEQEPENYKKTAQFLHANGFLVYKLTGVFSMDFSEGGLTQLFDTRTNRWSEELIRACEIDGAKLPEVYQCDDIAGAVSKEAAAETGLLKGIPVVAGSMDMVASALGTGVINKGDVYTAGGTVTATGICLDKPVFHKDFHVYSHIVPGKFLLAAGVDFGGGGLKWFRELTGLEDYKQFDTLGPEDRRTRHPLLFLPYMVGQRAPLWNSSTRGVICGIHPSTGIKELALMFMEGNALGTKRIIEKATFVDEVKNVRMTGGCAKSPVWMQIFADIIGKKIEIPGNMDVAVLGTAITAGIGAGIFSSYEAALKMVEISRTYTPDPSMTDYYRLLYEQFIALYENTIAINNRLAEINTKLSLGNGVA
jgi:xylulokinase